MAHTRDLTIKFNEIPSNGADYRFTHQSGELNSTLSDLLGDYPVYDASLNIQSNGAGLHLRGKVSGELSHSCSRCAEEFQTQFSKSFMTAYMKSDESLRGLNEISNIDGSFDLEFVDKESLHLGEVVHEQIALEIPFKALCSEDCKGLCTQCGANLNIEKCICNDKSKFNENEPKKGSPFLKLKELIGE